MKFKVLIALLLAVFFSMADTANAEEYDLAAYTCTQLMAEADQAMMPMVMWMDGYLSAVSDTTVIDMDWIETLSAHVVTHCSANPDATMMEVMEAL